MVDRRFHKKTPVLIISDLDEANRCGSKSVHKDYLVDFIGSIAEDEP